MRDASDPDRPDGRGHLAEVAAERDRLLLILKSMGDAVVCANACGTISLLNTSAESLTGWTQAEAFGMPIREVLVLAREDDPRASLDPAGDCMASGQTQISERGTVLTDRNGRQRCIGYSAAPICSASGEQLGTVMILNDVTEIRSEERKVKHQASHDPLTGLLNRASFLTALADLIETSKKQPGETHCLCFIDLDRFKQVNDSGGHAAGDAVLKEVAQIILSICTAEHVAARLGGDEFAVLMPHCDTHQAEWTASRIIRAISTTPFRWSNDIFRVGASIGATLIDCIRPPSARFCIRRTWPAIRPSIAAATG